ncbi:uncharacterized protein LOC135124080 [Zophobas morio]|uniref:uncharacterized protein LOC135124080 n=1 Tax=Zophobas morio TaxID=2755281 RepID=UPI003083C45B
MIKELVILAFLAVCCVCLPAQQPLQKVMAVVVQPEVAPIHVSVPENAEILATAESGWRNRGHGGGYGYGGGYGHGGGWRRGGGGYRGGYYGGGYKKGGYYH